MIYGLTGGIGAGKSAVANMLRERGYRVLNADDISREVTQKDSPLLRLLVKDFGIEIIQEDGELNRRKLAEIAFADKDKTRRLNELVQTAILVRAIEKVSRLRFLHKDDIVFFEVPMLFEAGWDNFVNKIWLVTAPADERVSRVMERDGLSQDEIKARMKLQMTEEEKMKRSDVIINNSGDLEDLEKQVEAAVAAL
ncbi:MAG: dephospho-CoA kinase [Firmicutes bacterium]|nr:dephospho-CoA kinase [Bacillota bacterium]